MTTSLFPNRFSVVLAMALVGAASLCRPVHASDPAPPPPMVQVFAADPAGAETGSDPATFVVLRLGSTEEPLTVAYTVGGTAVNGEDYESLPSEVTIPAGEYVAPIPVVPLDDFLVEGWEHVVIALDQPPTWPPPYWVAWPAVAVAYLEDNDLGPVNQPPQVTLLNPPDGALFQAPAEILLVAQASDPDGRVTSVEFFDGTTSLGVVTAPPWPPIIAVPGIAEDGTLLLPDPDDMPGIDEPLVEVPRRLFRLVWHNPPVGEHVLRALATDNQQATAWSEPATITVFEAPPQTVVTVVATDPEGAEVGPSGTHLDTGVFTVRRTGPTDLPLRVWYRLSGTAANGEDYADLPAFVLIPRGARAADIVVKPIDDLLVEGDESVVIALLPPVSTGAADPAAGDDYRLGRPWMAKMVLHDNDTPPNRPPWVRIVRPLNGATFVAPATVLIVAQAFDLDGQVVSVEFFEGSNSLGIVKPPAITPDSSSGRPAFVFEWTQVLPGHYVLSAMATDDDGATGWSRPVEIRVLPSSLPPVVEIETVDGVASEPGVLTVIDDATLKVTRTGATGRPLTVFYAVGGTAENGVDYTFLPGHVTISAGASETPLVIHPLHDLLVEGPEAVHIKLEEPPINSPVTPLLDYYIVGPQYQAKALIRDNDCNLSPKAEIVSPAEGAVFVAPADVEIKVVTVDPDGWVAKMQFFADGVLIGERAMTFIVPPEPGEPQTFRFTWEGAPLGRHVLTARAIDNLGAVGVTDPVHITVVGHPLLPIVTLEATQPFTQEQDPRVNTPNPPAVFKVARRGGDLTRALRVIYRISGTASNAVDYQRLSGEVVIEANEPSAAILVHPIDDDLVEGTEFVVLTLVQPDCVGVEIEPPADCYIVGEPNRAVAFIRDNDVPNELPKVALIEPANGAVFLAPVDIRLAATAVDADGWVHTVEFFANDQSLGTVTNWPWVVESVRLPGLDGTMLPGLEAAGIPIPPPFTLVWPDVPPGHYTLSAVATDNDGGRRRSAPVMIHVLEPAHPPVVTVFALDGFAREGTTNTALFSIRRVGPIQDPLTVHLRIEGTAANGVDYTRITTPVVIPAGRHSLQVPVLPIDDNLTEPPETVVLTIEPSPLDVFPPPYVVGLPDMAGALIVDNDHLVQRATRSFGDGTLHVRLPLAKGLPYRLEASVNLVDWEPVSEGIAVDEDGIDFVETGTGQCPRRFYRVVPGLNVESAGD